MHPGTFRKAMIEAYLAGATYMDCGCCEKPTKAEAKDWFDNEYGTDKFDEECDCCDDNE